MPTDYREYWQIMYYLGFDEKVGKRFKSSEIEFIV